MMTPPTIMSAHVRTRSPRPTAGANSPRQRGRRNAMADVTRGITADQLHSLEEMVQTFVPDFFIPHHTSSVIGRDGEEKDVAPWSLQRRNAVANVAESLSEDDLHHLEDIIRTYQPGLHFTTYHYGRRHSTESSSSSCDGEEASHSPTGPGPEYSSRRRNALANPLANMSEESMRRIWSQHNNRQRAV